MKNNPSVILDTNIFINGMFFKKSHINCFEIMKLILREEIQLIFSQETVGELFYMLKGFSKNQIEEEEKQIEIMRYMAELFFNSKSINTLGIQSPIIKDNSDNMFLKCAIKGNADYIISDDFSSGMHNIKDVNFKVVGSYLFIKEYGQKT